MIKDFEKKELTREDIFNKYLYIKNGGCKGLTPYAQEEIAKSLKKLDGKKTLEILIRGTITFDKGYTKLFTFLNKKYDISDRDSNPPSYEGYEEALMDLDNFNKFMRGEDVNWYSTIEAEYINYTKVQHAYIQMELT